MILFKLQWKTEIKSEINKIGARLIHKRDDDDGDDLLERKSAAYERLNLLLCYQKSGGIKRFGLLIFPLVICF